MSDDSVELDLEVIRIIYWVWLSDFELFHFKLLSVCSQPNEIIAFVLNITYSISDEKYFVHEQSLILIYGVFQF